MVQLHSLTYGPALRKAITRAEHRIWISLYVCTMNFKKRNDIIHILFIILQQKLKEGLDIRFIIDRPGYHKPNYHAAQFLIRRLKQWKFPFWLAPEKSTNHAKVILIDDACAFVGSHNLAKSSFSNPLEMSLEIIDPATCRAIGAWFQENFDCPLFEYFPPGIYDISPIYP